MADSSNLKTVSYPAEYINFLEDFVENTSEINFILNSKGEFIFVNNSFVKTLGYEKAEVKNKRITDYLHPQFKDEIVKDILYLKIDQNLTDYTLVFRNSLKKRVYMLGDIQFSQLQNHLKVYRFILRDITQRRRAEAAQNLYFAIAQSNLTTRNLQDFLAQVHLNLKENIYANNFFVAVYDNKDNSINFPYHVDEYFDTGQNYMKRHLGNGLIEYSLLQRKPLVLNKQELEELIEREKLFIYESVLPAVQIMVPLKINEQTTGVIGIKSYSDENKFSSNDLELLEFVSGQIAMTMERKKAEADLELQTARLKAVFDSSSHLLWTVNTKRQLSSLNRNYYNIVYTELGEEPKLFTSIERYGWKLFNPDDKPYIREKYNLAFAGTPQYFEAYWGQKNGGTEWYEFHLNPIISGENGEVEEVSGIARNITENKKTLVNLQKSENKFRNIIESFIDIYYRSDLAGNITMISPSVFKHTGYREDEVISQKVDQFFEDVADSSKNIKTLLKSGNITNYEVKVKRKDGTIRQFMLNIRMIKNEKGNPIEVEGVARDVTELLRSADELKIAKEQAEHSLKIKEQFLANMSHEIRTPMNGVIGMIDILSETELDKSQKDYVNTIRNSSETLLTILNDILDLSKLEAGKMNIENRPFDLRDTLKNLVALFKQKAAETNNILQYEWSDEVSPYIVGDKIRLLQILSNLTSNAIKFTQNGSITIKISALNKTKNEEKIKFEVIDTGIGISEENQSKLFESFQQLDISTKKAFGGTGLGLVISKELVELMGGNIGMVSKLGSGSTFWFTIQPKLADQKEIKSNPSIETEVSIEGYFKELTPKILLVDDNAINRKVAIEILKKAGCNVIGADSGKKAIETVQNNPDFDLIFMDIQMPEMDGIETTKALRRKFGKKLPKVVAMTAYSMQNDRENFLNNGMDDYLSKPIRANLLLQKVEECISPETIRKKKKVTAPHTKEFDELDQSLPAFDLEVVNSLKDLVGVDLLVTVYQDFEVEATEQIKNVSKAFDKKDVVTIQKELHTLKGNSGTIGLMRIHEITKEIETPAKDGILKDFKKKFETLNYEFEYFKKHYKDYCI
jgi:PAS domain S-box-containing protein